MKALIIILAILLALAILLLSRLRLSLIYDGRLRLRARYLFLRFTLYPRKDKTQKRRQKRKKKKKAKKIAGAADKEPSEGTAQPPTKKENGEHPPLRFRDIRVLFRIFRAVITRILDKARKHVRLRIRHLRITIGGERDAALAAIEYGLALQSTEYLMAYLEETGFFRRPEDDSVNVSVNFLKRGHSLDAHFDISCPLVFLFPLLFSALTTALQGRRQWARHRIRTAKALTATNNPSEKEQPHV